MKRTFGGVTLAAPGVIALVIGLAGSIGPVVAVAAHAAGKVTIEPRDRLSRKNKYVIDTMTRDPRAEEREQDAAVRRRIEEAKRRWRDEGRTIADGGLFGSSMRRRLKKFYAALRALQRNPKKHRLTIVQLGDSHTAGDRFSGYLRERLQRRFGDAGRGMLAPGRPYRYYRPDQTHVMQTLGWDIESSWHPENRPLLGITGYALRGVDPEDEVILEPKGLRWFRFVEVEFLRHPHAGSFVVYIDGKRFRTVVTRSKKRAPARVIFKVPGRGRKLRISPAGNGEIDLLSVSLYRQKTGGVAYVSHGVSGETVNVIDNWNRKIVRWQFHHLDPALVIVAYGTNEGFNYRLKPADYEREFRERLSFLMSAAPNASFVILGAPDAATLPPWCGRTTRRRDKYECRKLRASDAENYVKLMAQRSDRLCYWHAPPSLEQVREIQRRVARRLGAYYWDWSKVMGTCGLDRWSREEPPLAYSDRVHMTTRGYDVSAEAFYQSLMSHYSR
jgi:lysophospholipase L1-like esterase